MPGEGMPVRLLVFAKAPIPGRVKTRLVPPLTAEEAAAVGEACLMDVVARVSVSGMDPEVWYVEEEGASAWFTERLAGLPLRVQREGDLGERLADAFERSFAAGAERVLVLGADVPTVPPAVLGAAVAELGDGGAVVGPSLDGGYYLVGLNGGVWPAARALFGDVPWSTAGVFPRTLRLAGEAGIDLRVLPTWYDVDRPEDLLRVAGDVEEGSRLAVWLEGLDPARLRSW